MAEKRLSNKMRKKLLIDALHAKLGVISAACRAVGINRQLYYKWIADDPKFKVAVEEIPEIQVDFVESKLLQRINEGSDSAIIFFMKTKGKHRGYGENITVDNNIRFDFGINEIDEYPET